MAQSALRNAVRKVNLARDEYRKYGFTPQRWQAIIVAESGVARTRTLYADVLDK